MTAATPKLVKSLVIDMRLPNPCPLPTHFTQATSTAIEKNQLIGLSRFRFLREAAEFYFGICPKPTSNEYTRMAQALCDKYPQLKDKQEEYWVNIYLTGASLSLLFYFGETSVQCTAHILLHVFFYFQESVGDYLSQQFRNLRRPTDSMHKNDPKAKVVSSSLATPVVVNPVDVSVGL